MTRSIGQVKSDEKIQFEVEKVIDKKIIGKKTYYLLKWKNFPK
jgi:hypothetical protein